MTRDDKLLRAERAVIEAAERYRIELAGGYDGEAAGAHKKLLLAVEALQATRDPIPLDKVKTWEGES